MLDAALHLFAERGVNGTSLQMIADHLGVSKAAVYYQFHTKDAIVVAVVQPFFSDLTRLLLIAESIRNPQSRRDATISGFVEMAVRHRRVGSLFHSDPAVLELVRTHREFRDCGDRLRELLIGDVRDTETRVTVAMITAGIFGCTTEPYLNDVTDADLHRALLDRAHLLLESAVRPAATAHA